MYIYAEEFLLVNVLSNFCVLCCALASRRRRVAWARCAAAAILGAGYSLAALAWSGFWESIWAKAASLLVMALIITAKPALREVALNAALTLTVSLACSGGVMLVSALSATMSEALSSPVRATYPMLAAGFAAGCAGVTRLYSGLIIRMEGVDFSTADILVEGRTVKVTLLDDTGDALTTMGGSPVIILKKKVFTRLTGIEESVFEGFEGYEAFRGGLPGGVRGRVCALPASGVTGKAVLLGYRTDAVVLGGKTGISGCWIAGSDAIFEREFDGICNKSRLLMRCEL